MSSEPIFSVREFLEAVNLVLAEFKGVKVKGEIFYKNEGRGRYGFFGLKDPQSREHAVECYIAGRVLDKYGYLIEQGMEVVVQGVPGVYKTGRFRIKVSSIRPVGEGSLLRAFEKLKIKLKEQGYFAPERKRALPKFIQKIGLISSEGGAAVYDFLKNLGDYGFQIYFLDVYVEGDYAETSITKAISWFNRHRPDLDVLALVRGGGSLEALKAFNSESVAEAVFTSRLPVLTGIGHERDETIAGLVADYNVSTPTAAAQFLSQRQEQLILAFEQNSQRVQERLERLLETKQAGISNLQDSLIGVFENLLAGYRAKIRHAAALAQGILDKAKARLKRLEASLADLNPTAVLRRGFSITYTNSAQVVKKAAQVKSGQEITTRLFQGKIISKLK